MLTPSARCPDCSRRPPSAFHPLSRQHRHGTPVVSSHASMCRAVLGLTRGCFHVHGCRNACAWTGSALCHGQGWRWIGEHVSC